LTEPPEQRGGTLPTLAEARSALTRLKADLMARGEATDRCPESLRGNDRRRTVLPTSDACWVYTD
jgi:hypothetical protein